MSGLEAGLLVLDPGHFTTVQDLGRPGYRAVGVPQGGAFDLESHVIANALVGNEADAATLELTARGGVYQGTGGPLALGLAGARLVATIRGGDRPRSVIHPGCVTLREGEQLAIGGGPGGVRAYLAVAGGWRTPNVLGSRSSEDRIVAGALIPCPEGSTPTRWLARGLGPNPVGWVESSRPTALLGRDGGPRRLDPPYKTNYRDRLLVRGAASPEVLRIVTGPDGSSEILDVLARSSYRVDATSNRVGVRLDGPPIAIAIDPERLSSPVAPGAVQIAGKQPIVLGVACGTMGGYPHVAHVVSADLPRLAQLGPGGMVRFEVVELDVARRLDREWRAGLARFALRVRCAGSER